MVPNLAPSQELMRLGKAVQTDKEWEVFAKKYRAEMAAPEKQRVLDLLAALSHTANFALGCYCEVESRCHRTLLRQLLFERKAAIG